MSDLTTYQKLGVDRVVEQCRERGGFHSSIVRAGSMVAHALVLDGNRNAIRWWIGVDDTVEIEGIAEFDFEGNRVV